MTQRIERPQHKAQWWTIAGIGTEGAEMLISSTDRRKIEARLFPMQMRARVNAHRDIKLYFWEARQQVTYDMLDDPDYAETIMEMAYEVTA